MGNVAKKKADRAETSEQRNRLLREIERCDVRLRLLNCLEGHAHGKTLQGELLAHRTEVEKLLVALG